MPELPEVETVRAGMEKYVVGRTIATAAVLHPRAVRRDLAGPDGFAAAVTGCTFLRAERRGKYLWFALEDGWAARPSARTAALSGEQPGDASRGNPARRDLIGCPPDGEDRRSTGRASGPAPGGHSRYPPVWPSAADPAVTTRPVAESGIVPGAQPSGGMALLAHLGMSGQFLVGDPDRPLSPHVRVRFTFTDGGPDLRFTDQRTFGHLMLCGLSPGEMTPPATPPSMGGFRPPIAPLRGDAQKPLAPRAVAGVKSPGLRSAGGPETWPPGRLVPAPIAHIAPDPLEEAFDPKAFTERLLIKKTQLKRALLDQSLISGIGNIYADEALWRARLHWARPTDAVKRAEVSRLLDAVHDVLSEALKAGGTSFDALYVNVNGESGYFDRSLNAYGREGEPCSRCATPIRRDSFMNRSSYSCPRCQK